MPRCLLPVPRRLRSLFVDAAYRCYSVPQLRVCLPALLILKENDDDNTSSSYYSDDDDDIDNDINDINGKGKYY